MIISDQNYQNILVEVNLGNIQKIINQIMKK